MPAGCCGRWPVVLDLYFDLERSKYLTPSIMVVFGLLAYSLIGWVPILTYIPVLTFCIAPFFLSMGIYNNPLACKGFIVLPVLAMCGSLVILFYVNLNIAELDPDRRPSGLNVFDVLAFIMQAILFAAPIAFALRSLPLTSATSFGGAREAEAASAVASEDSAFKYAPNASDVPPDDVVRAQQAVQDRKESHKRMKASAEYKSLGVPKTLLASIFLTCSLAFYLMQSFLEATGEAEAAVMRNLGQTTSIAERALPLLANISSFNSTQLAEAAVTIQNSLQTLETLGEGLLPSEQGRQLLELRATLLPLLPLVGSLADFGSTAQGEAVTEWLSEDGGDILDKKFDLNKLLGLDLIVEIKFTLREVFSFTEDSFSHLFTVAKVVGVVAFFTVVTMTARSSVAFKTSLLLTRHRMNISQGGRGGGEGGGGGGGEDSSSVQLQAMAMAMGWRPDLWKVHWATMLLGAQYSSAFWGFWILCLFLTPLFFFLTFAPIYGLVLSPTILGFTGQFLVLCFLKLGMDRIASKRLSNGYIISSPILWCWFSVFMAILTIVTGLFFALKRLMFQTLFFLLSFFSFDATTFPTQFQGSDQGWLSFMSLVMLEHRHTQKKYVRFLNGKLEQRGSGCPHDLEQTQIAGSIQS